MIFVYSEVCIRILVKKFVEFLEESFHDACGSFADHWMLKCLFSFVLLLFCPDPLEPPGFSWPMEPSFSVPDWDLRELLFRSDSLEPPDFPWPTEPSFSFPDWDLSPFFSDPLEPPDFSWPTEPSSSVPDWDLREPPDFSGFSLSFQSCLKSATSVKKSAKPISTVSSVMSPRAWTS